MSLNINAAMPWFELVHHHLLVYDHTGLAWKLFQSWLIILICKRLIMDFLGNQPTRCSFMA